MAYEVIPSRQVVNYLKKLKEKSLKQKFLHVIYDEIAVEPYSGDQKNGALAGIWSKGVKYAGVTYRIAYDVINDQVIPVLLCGTMRIFMNS